MKGSGRRTFLQGKRSTKISKNEEFPAPGYYRLPSDFGHYENPMSTISHPESPRK